MASTFSGRALPEGWKTGELTTAHSRIVSYWVVFILFCFVVAKFHGVSQQYFMTHPVFANGDFSRTDRSPSIKVFFYSLCS